MNRFLNPTLTLTLAVAVLTMVAGQIPASGAVIGNVSTSDTTAITADLTAETPLVPTPKATYSRPLCRVMAYQKTLAVQATLVSNPRTAKILAVLSLLNIVNVHKALKHYLEVAEQPRGYTELEGIAAQFLSLIPDTVDEGAAWLGLIENEASSVELYEAIKVLSDTDLDVLLTLLTAFRFGQEECDSIDTEDSLFNHVARDLEIQMREHWTPDREFLSRRSVSQLSEISVEIGSGIRTAKKSDLVDALSGYFAKAKASDKPTELQQRACEWLPEAMNFPAIDPDVITEEAS